MILSQPMHPSYNLYRITAQDKHDTSKGSTQNRTISSHPLLSWCHRVNSGAYLMADSLAMFEGHVNPDLLRLQLCLYQTRQLCAGGCLLCRIVEQTLEQEISAEDDGEMTGMYSATTQCTCGRDYKGEQRAGSRIASFSSKTCKVLRQQRH